MGETTLHYILVLVSLMPNNVRMYLFTMLNFLRKKMRKSV